jgi:putative transposase
MKSVLQPWQLLLLILLSAACAGTRYPARAPGRLHQPSYQSLDDAGQPQSHGPLDGFPRQKRCLLMDRDSKHCQAFRELVERPGPRCVRLSPRSPNLSAHLERFIRSTKEECLDRMILCGDRSLRNAAQEFISHHHAERHHQGLGNRIIEPGDEVRCTSGKIACRERLGGMLRYYCRRAA